MLYYSIMMSTFELWGSTKWYRKYMDDEEGGGGGFYNAEKYVEVIIERPNFHIALPSRLFSDRNQNGFIIHNKTIMNDET